jgi:hypothetical protein
VPNPIFFIEIKRSLATKLFVVATAVTDCESSKLRFFAYFEKDFRARSHRLHSDVRGDHFIPSARALLRVVRSSSRRSVRYDFRQSQPSRRSGRFW